MRKTAGDAIWVSPKDGASEGCKRGFRTHRATFDSAEFLNSRRACLLICGIARDHAPDRRSGSRGPSMLLERLNRRHRTRRSQPEALAPKSRRCSLVCNAAQVCFTDPSGEPKSDLTAPQGSADYAETAKEHSPSRGFRNRTRACVRREGKIHIGGRPVL